MARKRNKQRRVLNIPRHNQEVANQEVEEAQEKQWNPLGNFTDKSKWDSFYEFMGSFGSFEWIAELEEFGALLLEYMVWKSSDMDKSLEERVPWKNSPAELRILVPGCGNSQLSEYLYDHGFQDIMNVDYSMEAIKYMLGKYVKEKPEMKWRNMDMTDLQFKSENFDVVVDKGGLDSLMDAMFGPKAGNLYLKEVKRVLTDGGKFICFSYAEPHVMDLLFDKFRIGWNMRIRYVPPIKRHKFSQSFMVVLEKGDPASVSDISSFLDGYTIDSHGARAIHFTQALDKEKKIREQFFTNNDIVYTIEELKLGAKGNISEVVPGRRIRLSLGEPGVSSFSYSGVLLDAKPDSGEINFRYSVFIVPKLRNHDEFYTSEKGQWLVSANSKSARLLLVLLDSCSSISSLHDIQIDLASLVKELTPAYLDVDAEIPIHRASEGIKNQEIVHQVVSDLTGPIIVEDVMYENSLTKDVEKYRRLIFQRSESMVQSEVRVSTKASIKTQKETKQEQLAKTETEDKQEVAETEKGVKKQEASVKTKKEVKQDIPVESQIEAKQEAFVETEKETKQEQSAKTETEDKQEVAETKKEVKKQEAPVKTKKEVKQDIPVKSQIEAKQEAFVGTEKETKQEASLSDEMEVDHNILASPYHNEILLGIIFNSSRLLLKIPHGPVKAVILGLGAGVLPMYLKKNLPNTLKIVVFELDRVVLDVATKYFGFKEDDRVKVQISDGSEAIKNLIAVEKVGKGFATDILVVDVNSTDPSSGLSCPGEDYVERSFLRNAKESLSDDGMLIMNLVSRSSSLKEQVYSRLTKVFSNIFRVEIEEGVSEVIFALKTKASLDSEACVRIASSLGLGDRFIEFIKSAERID